MFFKVLDSIHFVIPVLCINELIDDFIPLFRLFFHNLIKKKKLRLKFMCGIDYFLVNYLKEI